MTKTLIIVRNSFRRNIGVKKPHLLWMLAMAVASLAAPVSGLAQQPSGVFGVSPGTDCYKSFNIGTLAYCVSSHGNIVRLKAPVQGPEHIRVGDIREGYAVCTAAPGNLPQASHGAGNTESGFINPPTIIEGPDSITIIRTTALSNLKLTQTFTHNPAEREIVITMTVQNLNREDRWVRLDRYFDGDIAGDADDDRYNRSADAVWGEDGSHVVVLSDVTSTTDPSITHSTSIQAFGVFNAADCAQASVAAPTHPGDYVGRLSYELGIIPGFYNVHGGGQKTVRVQYRYL